MARTDEKIASVDTSLDILETLLSAEEMGVTELAEHLDVPKSTVYSHLYTLRERGYVTADDGRYQLSLKFLKFGELTRQSEELYQTAKPELDALAEETGELVNLMIEENGEGVYLYLTKGDSAVRGNTYPGLRVPLHCTALGKVTLAHMEPDQQEAYFAECDFESYTSNTITDPDVLQEELEDVREQGYALDYGERGHDLRCVAAPIIIKERFKGAISVTGPKPRMREERLTGELPEKLAHTASVIQINMIYDPIA